MGRVGLLSKSKRYNCLHHLVCQEVEIDQDSKRLFVLDEYREDYFS